MAGKAGEAVQPEAVPNSRKAGEDAVPSEVPGQMCREAGILRMGAEDAFTGRVGTGHQTQDNESPPENEGHRGQYDVDVVISGAKERSPAMTEPT
jgi:hypothetical protein